jgi:hypothetical protein
MSYIEEKYTKKIFEILENLVSTEEEIKELLSERNINYSEKIAKLCASCNKKINIILKKYYPEVKSLDSKLEIKSRMKFYYDLIDKLTDFVRNVDEFRRLDEKYFDSLIEFIESKSDLIKEKYRNISTNELTAFYDKKSRENLERILEQNLAQRERQFFTIGPLEEEIKKIGRIAGADDVLIFSRERFHVKDMKLIEEPNSLIQYSIYSMDEDKLKKIGYEIKNFLISKGYEALILLVELVDLDMDREGLVGNVLTNAELLTDF